ncbi:MAG: glutathione S-transferase [Sandaracinaceae bacterium]
MNDDTLTEQRDRYELFYWPHIMGRGELVRLVFEDAGVPYLDVARLPEDQGGGARAVVEMRGRASTGVAPFAPPILRVGTIVIAQTPLIVDFVGKRVGLVPEDATLRLACRQTMLTIMDVFAEAHDVHHPISVKKYFEEQKDAARAAAADFVGARLPELLAYFERILGADESPWLFDDAPTYADLALFQLYAGLRYMFPRAMEARAAECVRLMRVHDAVRARPGIADYLESARRLPFNEHGIFRYYEELDLV